MALRLVRTYGTHGRDESSERIIFERSSAYHTVKAEARTGYRWTEVIIVARRTTRIRGLQYEDGQNKAKVNLGSPFPHFLFSNRPQWPPLPLPMALASPTSQIRCAQCIFFWLDHFFNGKYLFSSDIKLSPSAVLISP